MLLASGRPLAFQPGAGPAGYRGSACQRDLCALRSPAQFPAIRLRTDARGKWQGNQRIQRGLRGFGQTARVFPSRRLFRAPHRLRTAAETTEVLRGGAAPRPGAHRVAQGLLCAEVSGRCGATPEGCTGRRRGPAAGAGAGARPGGVDPGRLCPGGDGVARQLADQPDCARRVEPHNDLRGQGADLDRHHPAPGGAAVHDGSGGRAA